MEFLLITLVLIGVILAFGWWTSERHSQDHIAHLKRRNRNIALQLERYMKGRTDGFQEPPYDSHPQRYDEPYMYDDMDGDLYKDHDFRDDVDSWRSSLSLTINGQFYRSN